jgi:hypothetical protein
VRSGGLREGAQRADRAGQRQGTEAPRPRLAAIAHVTGFCRHRAHAAALLALALLCVGATPALSDGDPASDVLATQPLFLPADAHLSARQQAQLVSLADAARRSGVSLRVAVIASPADLGSVTELWRQPQTYARFLAQELSVVYRGTLLVVMPNGFGAGAPATAAPSVRAALAGLPPPGSGSRLGTATLTAIERIASAVGHPLAAPASTPVETAGSTSSDVVPWLVFAAGAALIAVAWTLSLRARPLRRSRP